MTESKEYRSLERLVVDFTEAFNREDIDEVMSFFAEHAIYDEFNGVRSIGPAAIRRAFEPQFAGAYGRMRFHTEDMIAYPVASLKTLFREVAAGRPVMVLQNLSLPWIPQWHYAVVVGYDLAQGEVTLHSGVTKYLVMSMSTFERTWERSGYWGLLVLRPDDLPQGAEESLYVSAVAGVERAAQPRAAAVAYDNALKRWPDNLAAAMGLGNSLYRLGDRKGAAAAFRTASQRHPQSADAQNNLAHVLAEAGALDEAEKSARKAIRLGGGNVSAYRATLESILAKKRSRS